MLKRTLVVLLLLPAGLAIIWLGGWAYAITIALILGLAAWEYTRLMHTGGLQAAAMISVTAAILFALGRQYDEFSSAPLLLSLLLLLGMTYHLLAYEHGRDQAATDFGVTAGSALYIGWLGAYLVSLRNLPDGLGWTLLILPAVWFADSAAYLVGSRIGRHKMTPRLSPKKSWEGYLAGIFFGTLLTALLAAGLNAWIAPGSAITPLSGAVLGFALSVLPTLGDLGESMIKRQVGVKDSGSLLPGHGGAFDRIDSWLWAGVIGYYLIYWFFI